MTGMESVPEYQLEKISQPWDHGKIITREYLLAVAKLEQLLKASQSAMATYVSTTEDIRKLVVQLQDME